MNPGYKDIIEKKSLSTGQSGQLAPLEAAATSRKTFSLCTVLSNLDFLNIKRRKRSEKFSDR